MENRHEADFGPLGGHLLRENCGFGNLIRPRVSVHRLALSRENGLQRARSIQS